MNDAMILEALQKATTAAVIASSMPALPVKYLTLTFVSPNDQKYVECVFIPNNRENSFWGSSKQYMGMFRILLHWPYDGAGPYGPMQVLASIASYFSKDMWLGGLQITSAPTMTGIVEGGPDVLYPCGLRYAYFGE